MRKTILAIATIIALTAGNGFAQRYKSHEIPAAASRNSRMDNSYEEYQINKLDKIVGLTRKQENKIKKIENHYDRMMSSNRRSTYQNVQRLELQKQKEILSVLTPVQRQRLYAFQNAGKRNPWRG
jgi:Spy/CpxP family protein refolding chaperone